MDLERKTFKTTINNEEASLEFSRLAGKANAAVLGKYGETAVLVTAVMSKEDQDTDFFPLTVDYEERFYAVGKIMGSRFMRREGRPSDEATLSARLIDRTIRPLFDKRMRRSVQITITILAYDEKHDPDTIALLATSTALGVSDIPWNGPVAGASFSEEGSYNSFFAGPKGKINMVELGGKEIPEDKAMKIFEDSQKEIDRLIEFQESIIKEIGKPKTEIKFSEASQELEKKAKNFVKEKMPEYFGQGSKFSDLIKEFKELNAGEITEEDIKDAEYLMEEEIESFIKEKAIKENKRSDGRSREEIRPLYGEVGLFERTHGSAVFLRGETQILSIVTLAPPSAEKIIETIELTGKKRFMLHYNFPNFSVGETGRSRGPGRREIGHGALAAKAIEPFIPPKEDFPYTIRIVAETLSSNGSTSMGTVCASSMALMDAGVDIKSHVAGISIGLMSEGGKWITLTDIQGPEDHYGDMDLKIAGTKNGINAIQMDTKVEGIDKDIFSKSLPQAKKARLKIIELMEKVVPAPRENISRYAPTILTYEVEPEKIGVIIGPGGKTINGIVETAGKGVSIDIEDTGKVFVSAPAEEDAQKALEMVKSVVHEYQVGETVTGIVSKILDFGAIVELGGGQSGMIHISELADKYVEKVEDVIKEGDIVKAKVIKVENGKIGLSLKKDNRG